MNRLLDARDRAVFIGFGLVLALAAVGVIGLAVILGVALRLFMLISGL